MSHTDPEEGGSDRTEYFKRLLSGDILDESSRSKDINYLARAPDESRPIKLAASTQSIVISIKSIIFTIVIFTTTVNP